MKRYTVHPRITGELGDDGKPFVMLNEMSLSPQVAREIAAELLIAADATEEAAEKFKRVLDDFQRDLRGGR